MACRRASLAAADTPGTVAPESPPGIQTTDCAEARPTRWRGPAGNAA